MLSREFYEIEKKNFQKKGQRRDPLQLWNHYWMYKIYKKKFSIRDFNQFLKHVPILIQIPNEILYIIFLYSHFLYCKIICLQANLSLPKLQRQYFFGNFVEYHYETHSNGKKRTSLIKVNMTDRFEPQIKCNHVLWIHSRGTLMLEEYLTRVDSVSGQDFTERRGLYDTLENRLRDFENLYTQNPQYLDSWLSQEYQIHVIDKNIKHSLLLFSQKLSRVGEKYLQEEKKRTLDFLEVLNFFSRTVQTGDVLFIQKKATTLCETWIFRLQRKDIPHIIQELKSIQFLLLEKEKT